MREFRPEFGNRGLRDAEKHNLGQFLGSAFQDHRHRPLGHPSAVKLGLNSRVFT